MSLGTLKDCASARLWQTPVPPIRSLHQDFKSQRCARIIAVLVPFAFRSSCTDAPPPQATRTVPRDFSTSVLRCPLI